jgi:imidazolonepropionase-like amidohydrolase
MNGFHDRALSRGLVRLVAFVLLALATGPALAQVAVRAKTLHTMAGPAIENGLVLIGADGKIEYAGPASGRAAPAGYAVHECAVATPGLVDVRSTVGLTGIFNVPHDQDMIDRSAVIQPQLRAIDAYNPRERLVSYVRSFGVTTVHTGHAPGALITGQTLIAKTRGDTIEEAVIVPARAVVATLGPMALRGESPGTRARMMEMLRNEFFKARVHLDAIRKGETDEDSEPPGRDLKLEALAGVLAGELPLIVTANRSQDIDNAFRLADEFGFVLWLDSGSEAFLHADELVRRRVPVLLHPTMIRAWGEHANASYGTAKVLRDAGVTFAIQSGFEGYVPKVRVVLFEAGVAAGYGGLGFESALRAVTIDAAKILGVDDRVGSLEPGKDGDVAMYDGDPFEYTTHCVGVLIEGRRFGGEAEFEKGYP